jgi:hypothetical protein
MTGSSQDLVLDRLHYREYTIEILPDDDAGNPIDEDYGVTIVLHERAERRFGWTTDRDWGSRLNAALDQVADRGVTHRFHGPGGVLDIVNRWLRVVHRMPVVLPISALDHSGLTVYLGDGEHWADPGGFDSGWIGWLLVTAEQAVEWGPDPEASLRNARAAFAEFAAWIGQDVVGYRIIAPDGRVLDDCFGIYGSTSFREPDGWALLECRGIIDSDIAQQ